MAIFNNNVSNVQYYFARGGVSNIRMGLKQEDSDRFGPEAQNQTGAGGLDKWIGEWID